MAKFRNRTQHNISIGVYNGRDSVGVIPAAGIRHLAQGETVDLNFKDDTGYARVKVIWSELLSSASGFFGPYPNTSMIVVTYNNDDQQMADYSTLLNAERGRHGGAEPDLTMSGVSAVGTALLTAAGKGIAALGTSSAAPAAVVLAVGYMLFIALEPVHEQDLDPPDLQQIRDAVREVMAEEQDKHDADIYATTFLSAAVWLGDLSNLLASQAAPGTVPELSSHDREDFERTLEEFVSKAGTFQQNLLHVSASPEWGMFILPAFLAGIGAALHIHWMHDQLRFVEGGRVGEYELERFMDKAKNLRKSYHQAVDALDVYVKRHVRENHLDGTPEGDTLYRYRMARIGGADSPGKLRAQLAPVEEIERNIASDLERVRNGQPMQHYVKAEQQEAMTERHVASGNPAV